MLHKLYSIRYIHWKHFARNVPNSFKTQYNWYLQKFRKSVFLYPFSIEWRSIKVSSFSIHSIMDRPRREVEFCMSVSIIKFKGFRGLWNWSPYRYLSTLNQYSSGQSVREFSPSYVTRNYVPSRRTDWFWRVEKDFFFYFRKKTALSCFRRDLDWGNVYFFFYKELLERT